MTPKNFRRAKRMGLIWSAVVCFGLPAFLTVAANEDAGKWVQPLPPKVLNLIPKNSRAERLMASYYESVVRWDDVLLQRSKPVPSKPGCIFYGEGGEQENDIRPIAYATLVNAFLAVSQFDGYPIDAKRREKMRAEAIGTLRYLVQGHITGGGTCVNGKRWGNHWQSAMWARSLVFAGWILWPKLPADLQSGVARIAEFEADRFLKAKLKSSEFNDTGAEENAWDAQILALGCNMMPRHPRATPWANEAKRWMYNAFSVAADRQNNKIGDDGKLIKDWVQTTNIHSDFTVENHGIVHLGYLKTTLAMLLENSLPYLLTSSPVPRACQHHTAETFEVLCRCMGWDGAPIYFSGNDWKITHTHGNDIMAYAFMSVLQTNRAAAHLEETAISYLPQLQKAEGGFYNCRRDLESGGMSATRIIAAIWAHALLGEGASPISKEEFQKQISGVTLLENGKVILHRTPTKFASFSWGQKRMALSYPENGSWILWPHFDSYVGQINDLDPSIKHAKLTALQRHVASNRFDVSCLLTRKDGAEQSVFFASLPGDVTVYIERIRPAAGTILKSRETGIVGLEYDLNSNERLLKGSHGMTKAIGVGGDTPRVFLMNTDWLNISERVGYVVRRAPTCRNLMRYHDEPKGIGRTPQLQEWISLIGEGSEKNLAADGDWACIVTFLNQSSAETEQMAKQIEFSVTNNLATCRLGTEELRADFGPLTK